MFKAFHGIDRHKEYSTISVRNREGHEIEFVARCVDLREYINALGPEDAVVMEASTGSFYWSDLVESTGAACYILDAFRFRIIKDSWKKTDKHDARNMAAALWAHLMTGEFEIPAVHKPDATTRKLRRLFSQYRLLNRQIRVFKNRALAMTRDMGIEMSQADKLALFNKERADQQMAKMGLVGADILCVQQNLELIWQVQTFKMKVVEQILLAGEPLEKEILLLITITGVTPLSALAFLSDVGDVRRFKSLGKMCSYLGLVPTHRQSGGKSISGHINRASRDLTRTLFTQSITHLTRSSPYFKKIYAGIGERRGWGRARIAMIRKLCGIMRRMLLSGETFRWMKQSLFQMKVRQYERVLQKLHGEARAA